jgi:hypothetical protein
MKNVLILVSFVSVAFALELSIFPTRVFGQILSSQNASYNSFYIDPGTGSLIIQVLIGVIAGGLVALRIFWARVKLFVRSLFSKNSDNDKTGK